MAHILVVDDDPSVREALRVMLESEGHRVSEAPGGEEAIDAIRETPFDCVLLDVLMPDVDGFQVLRLKRTMPGRAGIPVIVITGRHEPDAVIRAMELGAADHIAKPFPPLVVESAVQRVLAGAPAEERRRTLLHGAHATMVGRALNRVVRVPRALRLARLFRRRG